jgi:hypothetical protein
MMAVIWLTVIIEGYSLPDALVGVSAEVLFALISLHIGK